ncbi:MAG: hypothetical protein AB8H80_04500 [Planctomycetota bacterium]
MTTTIPGAGPDQLPPEPEPSVNFVPGGLVGGLVGALLGTGVAIAIGLEALPTVVFGTLLGCAIGALLSRLSWKDVLVGLCHMFTNP